MCILLAKELPKLRALLHLSQSDFGARCGISRERITKIETGSYVMSWNQLCAILFVCMVNRTSKEFFFVNDILPPVILQYMQQKDENMPPEYSIAINESIVTEYSKMLEINRSFRENVETLKPSD